MGGEGSGGGSAVASALREPAQRRGAGWTSGGRHHRRLAETKGQEAPERHHRGEEALHRQAQGENGAARALKSKRIREHAAKTKKLEKSERTKQRKAFKAKVDAQFKEVAKRFPIREAARPATVQTSSTSSNA